MAVERLVTTDQQQPEITASQVPVETDGDFCLSGDEQQRIELLNRGFTMMEDNRIDCSIGLETPIDEETGLPFAILPISLGRGGSDRQRIDFHHHFHPAVFKNASDAMLAVRMSRGQDLPRWLHEHYHHYFAGPKLPHTREQAFMTSVLACAGVVPRQILDFSGNNGPNVRTASHREYDAIAQTVHREAAYQGKRGLFQKNRIGIFFANYAVEQDFTDIVSQTTMDEFLHTQDPDVRLKLGNTMLKVAVNLAVEPVRPLFKEFRRNGMLAGQAKDPRVVIASYFVSSRLPDYHVAVVDRIKATAA